MIPDLPKRTHHAGCESRAEDRTLRSDPQLRCSEHPLAVLLVLVSHPPQPGHHTLEAPRF